MGTFKIFPMSGGDLPLDACDLAGFKVGRLASNEENSPLVLTDADLLRNSTLGAKDIAALSFDGMKWWWPSGNESEPERGADDDAGEFMRQQFAQDIERLIDGTINRFEVERHFRSLGIRQSSADEALSDWTDDPGEEDVGWTDDAGEEE